jgi:repressor LexA
LRVGSTRTLYRYLRKLEDDGLIERHPGVAGVKLLKSGVDTNAVPIVGDVQAGSLTLAEQNIVGWLRLPRSMTGPGKQKFFLLRVRGTSMNKAIVGGDTIEDGDLVLVRQQSSANSGDVVVALVDNEATVKRLVVAPGYFILKPESIDERHQPIIVEKNFRVQGKVRRVLKRGSELLHSLFDE